MHILSSENLAVRNIQEIGRKIHNGNRTYEYIIKTPVGTTITLDWLYPIYLPVMRYARLFPRIDEETKQLHIYEHYDPCFPDWAQRVVLAPEEICDFLKRAQKTYGSYCLFPIIDGAKVFLKMTDIALQNKVQNMEFLHEDPRTFHEIRTVDETRHEYILRATIAGREETITLLLRPLPLLFRSKQPFYFAVDEKTAQVHWFQNSPDRENYTNSNSSFSAKSILDTNKLTEEQIDAVNDHPNMLGELALARDTEENVFLKCCESIPLEQSSGFNKLWLAYANNDL